MAAWDWDCVLGLAWRRTLIPSLKILMPQQFPGSGPHDAKLHKASAAVHHGVLFDEILYHSQSLRAWAFQYFRESLNPKLYEVS